MVIGSASIAMLAAVEGARGRRLMAGSLALDQKARVRFPAAAVAERSQKTEGTVRRELEWQSSGFQNRPVGVRAPFAVL